MVVRCYKDTQDRAKGARDDVAPLRFLDRTTMETSRGYGEDVRLGAVEGESQR